MYGWIAEYAFQMISGDLYLIISMLFASFFISICLHHRAFSEQFQALLNELSACAAAQVHAEQNQNDNVMRKKRIRTLLQRIIQFHILLTE